MFLLLIKRNRPILFHIFHRFWQRFAKYAVTGVGNQNIYFVSESGKSAVLVNFIEVQKLSID